MLADFLWIREFCGLKSYGKCQVRRLGFGLRAYYAPRATSPKGEDALWNGQTAWHHSAVSDGDTLPKLRQKWLFSTAYMDIDWNQHKPRGDGRMDQALP
jgi:hypothetical protein